jgi:hypothetical protein
MSITFRKPSRGRSVMFAVTYDDGRTAYLWLDESMRLDDIGVMAIALDRQAEGEIPAGRILTVRRVR